jgi:hypothetical protein
MTIKMRKPVAPATAEEFVSGATATPPTDPAAAPVPTEFLPWKDPKVRDDLRVQVNVKLPDKLLVQRDWIAARLGMTKQEATETALRAWVRAELRKLGLPDN